MRRKLSTDPLVRNIAYLSVLVFVLSLQVLIVLAFVYQYVPIKMDPITSGVPSNLLKLFHPNRNYTFYHAFIAVAIIGQAVVLYIYRKRLRSPDLAGEIRGFLICETVWVLWQLFAVFKILQYNNPGWARILLYAGFAAALLAKIFWPELKRGLKLLPTFLQGEIPALWCRLADGGIILVLFLTIMIPDTEKALSRLALVDSNNNFDQWLMAPLWAYHKGLIPALQAFNPLNWGVPVLINALVNFTGGVTYGHVITILCFLAVVYYTVFYYFLRFWLGILPAALGVLLAVKLQMFNMGINPLIWIFPGQSVLRHLFDVGVFFCLLCYARGRGELFLWMAAAAVGISLTYVFDTGVYMVGAFYAYVAVLILFKDTRAVLCSTPKQWRKVLGLVFVPWFLMVIMLGLCFGPVVLHREFWFDSFKDIPRWLAGADTVSILSCLRDRNFYAFFASFAPPLIYTAGAAAAVSMVYFHRWKSEKLFIIPVSVYGLGVYAHFLWHGTINFYYMAPLPLAASVCFWGTECLQGLTKSRQRLVKLILAAAAGIALFTNFLFTYYPNVFNMAQDDWSGQKAYYRANFIFQNDSDFIRQWTLPGQRVALINGFETQLLLQAGRAPFFYKSMTLMSPADIQPMVDQLDKDKPGQVFINKNMLSITGNTPLSVLMDYLRAHYQYTGKQSDDLALLERIHG